MILKVLSRHSAGGYKQLVNYIFDEKKLPHNFKPIIHNLLGQNKYEWLKEFYKNETYRNQQRKNQVALYHAILSFSELDKQHLNHEIMENMVRKFYELRGNQGIYLGAIHEDKGHLHAHVIMSGLELKTGKSFWCSKTELKELKQNLQQYQKEKYPNLIHSLPNHGQDTTIEQKKTRKTNKQDIKNKIDTLLKDVQSKEQALSILLENGYYHYERGGRPYGITMDDRNYRFKTLGLDFDTLPETIKEKSAHELALEEIRNLREQAQHQELSRDDSRDFS